MSADDIKKIVDDAPAELPLIFADFAEALPEQYVSIKYPLDALGPMLGGAAKQLAYHIQVPEGIAAQSVLSAASLIAQAHINVQRGNIGVGPVSIFCLSVAESGDRKSTVDRLALAPVRTYENKRLIEQPEKEKRYKSELDSWTIRRNKLIKAYILRAVTKCGFDSLTFLNKRSSYCDLNLQRNVDATGCFIR